MLAQTTARRKERANARRAQKTRENREKRLALKAAKKAAKKPAKNVRKPAKVTRNINVNIQVAGTSQQVKQTAGLEPLLEGFKTQPYETFYEKPNPANEFVRIRLAYDSSFRVL